MKLNWLCVLVLYISVANGMDFGPLADHPLFLRFIAMQPIHTAAGFRVEGHCTKREYEIIMRTMLFDLYNDAKKRAAIRCCVHCPISRLKKRRNSI